MTYQYNKYVHESSIEEKLDDGSFREVYIEVELEDYYRGFSGSYWEPPTPSEWGSCRIYTFYPIPRSDTKETIYKKIELEESHPDWERLKEAAEIEAEESFEESFYGD